MALGDSITAGSITDAPGSYRNELYTLLNTEGFNVDFVGNEQDSAVDNPSLPDRDHQGVPGIQINGIRATLPITLKTVESPDLILVHAGTNDFGAGASPAVVLERTRSLIRDLSSLKPHAKILVASLITRTDNAAAAANQDAFASALPGLITEESSLGRQAYYVQMHTELLSSDLADGLHPNASGYAKMAAAWRNAILGVITPYGTADAPEIASLDARSSLNEIKVAFSKPVEDAAADPLNFGINGGINISAASLDASKRIVTLTTSTMTAGEVLTLTVNGVKDRTTAQNEITPNTTREFIARPLTDGSFENGGAAWTGSGVYVVENSSGYPSATATDGTNFLVLNGNDQTPNGQLSQIIPTASASTGASREIKPAIKN